ncbi:MAG: hypothetical protein IPK73_16060 [Candidatus Obscuribacter sp.]|nr:hypothetical protein [Candidatus Obscuribacter sp.]MBK9278853.1 hypothetical protein [Candidatus Obscuribacter sp.]
MLTEDEKRLTKAKARKRFEYPFQVGSEIVERMREGTGDEIEARIIDLLNEHQVILDAATETSEFEFADALATSEDIGEESVSAIHPARHIENLVSDYIEVSDIVAPALRGTYKGLGNLSANEGFLLGLELGRLARLIELTTHETALAGSASRLKRLSSTNASRQNEQAEKQKQLAVELQTLLDKGMPHKEAVKEIERRHQGKPGWSKASVKRMLSNLKRPN